MDWTIVVASGVSVVGVLGGVALTQRYAVREAERGRIEASRRDARDLIAQLLVDSKAFVDNAWLMVPMLSKMTEADMREFIETDSGREIASRRARLQLQLARVRLLVGESELRTKLIALDTLLENWAEVVHGPVLEAKTKGGDAVAAAGAGFKHINALDTLVDDIRSLASDVLITPLDTLGRSPRRRLLHRKSEGS